jgi:phage tail sheath protein FI
MPIFPSGQLNLASLTVDNVYIIVVPPGTNIIRGVPTNIMGIVGTASWGPFNAAIQVGSSAEVGQKIGFPTTETHDIATACEMAMLGGCTDFRCVRVGDGTQAKAVTNLTNNATPTPQAMVKLTAMYEGTQGNALRAYVETGSAPGTAKLTVFLSNVSAPRETYDNLAYSAADYNVFLQAVNVALTNGQGPLRPPSVLVVASPPTGTPTSGTPAFTVPGTPLTYVFTGGLNGATSAGATQMIGDPILGTGMYRLENTDCQVFILFGLTTPANWSTAVNFGKTRGMLFVSGFALGTDTAAAVTAKQNAGLDSYDIVPCKDHILWRDPINGLRLVSPEALAGGLIAATSPEQGVGNKAVFGIEGTERTQQQLPYTDSEITTLTNAGINFFTNPIPAGYNFGLRHNQNGSSELAISGVNYTRMTHFLAASLNQSLGKFIGRIQSSRPNDQTRADAKATLLAFLNKLKNLPQQGGTGMIDDFSLKLDEENNPPEMVGQGYLQAQVAIRYLAVVRFFVVYLQGGQTVTIVSAQPGGNSIAA